MRRSSGVGEHVDRLKVAFEVQSGLIKQAKNHVLDRLDLERDAPFENRRVVRHDDHEVILVNENAGRGELEQEIVIRTKALRTLEDDRGVVGLEFQTRKLVRI